jgi:hypothetical protein
MMTISREKNSMGEVETKIRKNPPTVENLIEVKSSKIMNNNSNNKMILKLGCIRKD